jgi:hypothetical protein
MGKLTVTAAQLDRARSVPTFDPIFWTARGGTLIAADWAEGFLQAIMLRMDAWDRAAQVQARWPATDPDPGALRRRKRRILPWPAAGRRVPHHAGGGRVRPGVRHRDRRLLAQKRTAEEVQEMLRQGRLKIVAGPPRFSPDAHPERVRVRAINANAARRVKRSPRPGVQSLPRASPQSTGGWLFDRFSTSRTCSSYRRGRRCHRA